MTTTVLVTDAWETDAWDTWLELRLDLQDSLVTGIYTGTYLGLFGWFELGNTAAPMVYRTLGTDSGPILDGYCPFHDGNDISGSISYSTWVDLDGDGISDIVCETK